MKLEKRFKSSTDELTRSKGTLKIRWDINSLRTEIVESPEKIQSSTKVISSTSKKDPENKISTTEPAASRQFLSTSRVKTSNNLDLKRLIKFVKAGRNSTRLQIDFQADKDERRT